MAKVIVSPSKVWPGTVTLQDPLTLPMVAAYYKAVRAARALESAEMREYYRAVALAQLAEAKEAEDKQAGGEAPKGKAAKRKAVRPPEDPVSLWEWNNAMMPGVLACVERCELKGLETLTAETFPAQPRREAAELAAWLIDAVREMVMEAEEPAPKDSSGSPMPASLDLTKAPTSGTRVESS